MPNKYEKLFDEFLDLVEFKLIKHQSELEDEDGLWSLIDLQGANLGDIESDRFKTASDIFDRMDIYITDYFLNDIDELLEEKGIKATWGGSCEDYLIGARDLLPDAAWEFEVLDMICYHTDEINLENCTYEENE